ncbi:4a-hydroxytetrahydrobiopterin dehydratase [Microbacteriaceae bacterium VKM Ac-2855]|nr:4a-hydroxytetrahydrobiopterin dehydratase [Microbacteriaceae bacterium VKM Ac-2855]
MTDDQNTDDALVVVDPADFHAAPGVGDWRVLFWGAQAFYRTSGFAQAAAFVSGIANVAVAIGHDPDVDLRPEGVTIRTCSRADGALGAKDIELAASVSAIAHRMALEADPSRVQVVGIAVAQDAGADTRPFWEAVFGYSCIGDEDLVDPLRRGPHLWFHEVRPPRPGRGRTHIDVSVPADQAEPRVRAAVAAGGRIADDSHAPKWWTLASPDNHGVDIAGWADGRD